MIALDSIEIVDKDLINVSWFDNGNHFETWDSNDIFNYIIDLNDEIERLNNIIKEVREYITTQQLHKFQDTTGGLTWKERELLKILDKEKR